MGSTLNRPAVKDTLMIARADAAHCCCAGPSGCLLRLTSRGIYLFSLEPGRASRL